MTCLKCDGVLSNPFYESCNNCGNIIESEPIKPRILLGESTSEMILPLSCNNRGNIIESEPTNPKVTEVEELLQLLKRLDKLENKMKEDNKRINETNKRMNDIEGLLKKRRAI